VQPTRASFQENAVLFPNRVYRSTHAGVAPSVSGGSVLVPPEEAYNYAAEIKLRAGWEK